MRHPRMVASLRMAVGAHPVRDAFCSVVHDARGCIVPRAIAHKVRSYRFVVHHTALVAETGDTFEARRAGTNTAAWPSNRIATTPTSTDGTGR